MPKHIIAIFLILFACNLQALDAVRVETRTVNAFNEFGVTGRGVTIAVLDRGISWDHPDFINENGSSRIRWMLDMSGQDWCNSGNPEPVEYSQSEINQALANGTGLAMRDAVGHGTATAGTAAGNGRALTDRRYQGIAPEADLIVVKLTSEGAPAHGNVAAETPFQGCTDEAIDWASEKMDELNQPGVLIINSGTQWGPMDGSSAISRKLMSVFPEDEPGRIVVLPSGDERSLPNHAKAGFDAMATTQIGINKATDAFGVISAWYDGQVPAEITLQFDDGTSVGPVGPGQSMESEGITVVNYNPGTEFYPWSSDSGDRAVWIGGTGHSGNGSFQIRALNASDGLGEIDVYGDVLGSNLTPVMSMTDHLTPGRLQDWATTASVIVAGDHNIRTSYSDIDGVFRSIDDEGMTDDLWLKSSAGPSRDGRDYGVDVTAPGQNMFSPVGADSNWATMRGNQPSGGEGLYIRFGGTSASAPIVLGAVALMLQVNPTMTASQARQILRETARQDAFTGVVPNTDWGYGKLDVHAAVARALAYSFSGPWFNVSQPGHGWFIEMLEGADGKQRLNVYWYVYTNGKPAWILATGPLEGSQAHLDAYITSGGEFPPDFTGADVFPWGSLDFDFNADGSGTASWTTDFEGFSSGSMPIAQLGRISGHPGACASGSFFNPNESGHGFVIEVITIAGVENALVAWYVYLDGEQVWLLGQAPISNGRAEIALSAYSGAQFPPDFLAGDVVSTPWGTLILEMVGPDTALASWQTSQPGYSSGNMDLIRLTGLGGHDCNE